MKALVLLGALVLFPMTLDAAKGGKPKPTTCGWDVYYACIEAGGDRLYCLSQCMSDREAGRVGEVFYAARRIRVCDMADAER